MWTDAPLPIKKLAQLLVQVRAAFSEAMATSEEQERVEQSEGSDLRSRPAAAAAAAAAESTGTPEDLISWFNDTIKEYDATFIVYYRGLW